MNPRVLFLDIDGVINSERSRLAFGGYPHDFTPEEYAKFDPVALALIQRLCRVTECSVVLSTSWRTLFTLEQVARGLDLPVMGATPDLGSDFTRVHEIAFWLEQHPEVTSYAIVDDLFLDWSEHPELEARFVQTNPDFGLSLSDYRELRHHLAPGCYA